MHLHVSSKDRKYFLLYDLSSKRIASIDPITMSSIFILTYNFIILFFAEQTSKACDSPLGMEHGHIKDADITASSAFDFKSVGPQNARLRKDMYGGAWCPKSTIAPGVREWIQVWSQTQFYTFYTLLPRSCTAFRCSGSFLRRTFF